MSVTACILLKVDAYLAQDMPVLFCGMKCVACFCVHRKPYPSSNWAASAVGSTADRCPDRGGGWAADGGQAPPCPQWLELRVAVQVCSTPVINLHREKLHLNCYHLKSVNILNVYCRFILKMVSVSLLLSLLPPLLLNREVSSLSLFIKYLRVFLRDKFGVNSRCSVTVILPHFMCFLLCHHWRKLNTLCTDTHT